MTLGTLLDRVERGEEVAIIGRGWTAARLVPADSQFNRAEARATAARIVEPSKEAILGGLTIGELLEEGRR